MYTIPVIVLASSVILAFIFWSKSPVSQMEIHIAPTTDALSIQLAQFVVQLSKQSIQKHGSFFLAISGGSLPSILAAKLKTPDFSGQVEWAKWSVWFVDERYVPLDHSDSNYKASYDNLFTNVPIPLSSIHSPDVSLPLKECALDYQKKLEKEFGNKFPVFDLILLGMGPDGHTASLFPHHPLLHENTALVASIADSPKPPPERITFTLPLLNNADTVAFVASGESKKEMLQRIIEAEDVPVGELPSKLVRPSSGHLHWFIDAPAGSLLKQSKQ